MSNSVLLCGGSLSNCILANLYKNYTNYDVKIIEQRKYIGGKYYDRNTFQECYIKDEFVKSYVESLSTWLRINENNCNMFPINGYYNDFLKNLVNETKIEYEKNWYDEYTNFHNYKQVFVSGSIDVVKNNIKIKYDEICYKHHYIQGSNLIYYNEYTFDDTDNKPYYYYVKNNVENSVNSNLITRFNKQNSYIHDKIKKEIHQNNTNVILTGNIAKYEKKSFEETISYIFNMFKNLNNFLDLSFKLKINSLNEKILYIIRERYNNILKREPDKEGMNVYINLLTKHKCSNYIIEEFEKVLYNSEEYKNKKNAPDFHPKVDYSFIEKIVIKKHEYKLLPKTDTSFKTHYVNMESKMNNIIPYFGNFKHYKTKYVSSKEPHTTINFELLHEPYIVVSRYNENVDWTNIYDKKNLKIYNKGKKIEQSCEHIENIGREGHTYLTYIIENYENLEDYIVFTQGDPFEHSPSFIKLTKKYYKYFNKYQPLTWRWKDYDKEIEWLSNENSMGIPPMECRKKFGFFNIEDCTIYCELLNRNFEAVYPYKWVDGGFNKQLIPRLKERKNIDTSVLEWVYEKIGLNKSLMPEYIPFNYSAVFGVSKYNILKYKKDIYISMRKFLLEHSDNGYICERLWMHLFSN